MCRQKKALRRGHISDDERYTLARLGCTSGILHSACQVVHLDRFNGSIADEQLRKSRYALFNVNEL